MGRSLPLVLLYHSLHMSKYLDRRYVTSWGILVLRKPLRSWGISSIILHTIRWEIILFYPYTRTWLRVSMRPHMARFEIDISLIYQPGTCPRNPICSIWVGGIIIPCFMTTITAYTPSFFTASVDRVVTFPHHCYGGSCYILDFFV